MSRPSETSRSTSPSSHHGNRRGSSGSGATGAAPHRYDHELGPARRPRTAPGSAGPGPRQLARVPVRVLVDDAARDEGAARRLEWRAQPLQLLRREPKLELQVVGVGRPGLGQVAQERVVLAAGELGAAERVERPRRFRAQSAGSCPGGSPGSCGRGRRARRTTGTSSAATARSPACPARTAPRDGAPKRLGRALSAVRVSSPRPSRNASASSSEPSARSGVSRHSKARRCWSSARRIRVIVAPRRSVIPWFLVARAGTCRVTRPRCGQSHLSRVRPCPPSRGWPCGGELPMP